jgi:hypothetical protein
MHRPSYPRRLPRSAHPRTLTTRTARCSRRSPIEDRSTSLNSSRILPRCPCRCRCRSRSRRWRTVNRSRTRLRHNHPSRRWCRRPCRRGLLNLGCRCNNSCRCFDRTRPLRRRHDRSRHGRRCCQPRRRRCRCLSCCWSCGPRRNHWPCRRNRSPIRRRSRTRRCRWRLRHHRTCRRPGSNRRRLWRRCHHHGARRSHNHIRRLTRLRNNHPRSRLGLRCGPNNRHRSRGGRSRTRCGLRRHRCCRRHTGPLPCLSRHCCGRRYPRRCHVRRFLVPALQNCLGCVAGLRHSRPVNLRLSLGLVPCRATPAAAAPLQDMRAHTLRLIHFDGA